jgi:hypothetical protein
MSKKMSIEESNEFLDLAYRLDLSVKCSVTSNRIFSLDTLRQLARLGDLAMQVAA